MTSWDVFSTLAVHENTMFPELLPMSVSSVVLLMDAATLLSRCASPQRPVMLSHFQGFLFICVFPSFKSCPPLLCTVIVLVSPQTSAQGKDGVTHLGVTGTLRGFRQLADMPIPHLTCEREAGGSDGPGDTCTPSHGVYNGEQSQNRHSAVKRR